ncbi:MAG: site-specific DNA-methyltransferase [Patescibacteria group bacterium]|nr:site-specific DNA-methyltransferase [Patescibacteria group bacterium]
MTLPLGTIVQGDALAVLRTWPDACVQCVVTSPPYWGLRDYRQTGQGGLEPTFAEHLAWLVEVFREVRRVLRPDGTLWLNYGDGYASRPNGTIGASTLEGNKVPHSEYRRANGRRKAALAPGWKHKDLIGMAWRVAFALQADGAADAKAMGVLGRLITRLEARYDGPESIPAPVREELAVLEREYAAAHQGGWWLRSRIVWAKGVSFCPTYSGSCMPESATDRPTSACEELFLLTKRPRYFYDAWGCREATSENTHSQGADGQRRPAPKETDEASGIRNNASFHQGWRDLPPENGRNLRNVWAINPQPYPGAHFAVFPEALVDPCIRLGTSEHGACPACGAPWARVVKKQGAAHGPSTSKYRNNEAADRMAQARDQRRRNGNRQDNPFDPGETLGWRPTCRCDAGEPVPCVVLDPFAGSGTVLVSAYQLGRVAVGIDLAGGNCCHGNLVNPMPSKGAVEIECTSIVCQVGDGQHVLRHWSKAGENKWESRTPCFTPHDRILAARSLGAPIPHLRQARAAGQQELLGVET